MMDLLVQITTAHRINPGGHVIQVMNARSDDFLYYKPSTPIGERKIFLFFFCIDNLTRKVDLRVFFILRVKKNYFWNHNFRFLVVEPFFAQMYEI